MTRLQIEKRCGEIETKHRFFKHIESLLKDGDVKELEVLTYDSNKQQITAVFNFDK